MHTEIPPQQWQGNTDAPLWVLLTNPGYDSEDSRFYKLAENREAPLAQLQFQCLKGKHWHYVLNDEHQKWIKEDGSERSYSWTWFYNRFVNPVKNALKYKKEKEAFDWLDKNVFLLQTYGYASVESTDKDFPLRFHSQSRFIRKLLHWGVDNKKCMYIVRSEVLWRYWLDEENELSTQMLKDKQLIINNFPRNSYLPQNIILRIDKYKSF